MPLKISTIATGGKAMPHKECRECGHVPCMCEELEKMKEQTRRIKSNSLSDGQLNLLAAIVSFTEQNWSAFLLIAEDYQIDEDDADRILSELGNL